MNTSTDEMIPQPGRAGPVTVNRLACPSPDMLAEWDALVGSTSGTDITQMSSWARVRRHAGFTPTYLTVRENGLLVGGAQLLWRDLPGLGRIGYLPYGPLIGPAATDRPAAVHGLGQQLARLDRRTRMLFVQPPEGAEDVTRDLRSRGFRPSTAGIAPTGSTRVDLSASEEEIRGRFSRRLRSWPTRWATCGVSVRRGDESDLPLLARLIRASAAVHGFRPPGLDHLDVLYQELVRHGTAALFVGELHGSPVCADLVTMCGDMVRGRLGGLDRAGDGARVSAPAAVRWEIIRWAKRSGYRWLDFGGLSDRTLRDAVEGGLRDSSTWLGPDRTKMSFGGEVFRYPPPVELIRPRPLQVAYDTCIRSPLGRAVLSRAKLELRTRSGSGAGLSRSTQVRIRRLLR